MMGQEATLGSFEPDDIPRQLTAHSEVFAVSFVRLGWSC